MKILSMGWGVQTWTMAAMMALDEMPRADYLVFADTTHESQQTYDFIKKWTPWAGNTPTGKDRVPDLALSGDRAMREELQRLWQTKPGW